MGNYEIQFKFNDDRVSLLVVFKKETAESLAIDAAWVVEQLNKKGYGKLQIEEKGIERLVTKLNAASADAGSICIAKKKDAEVEIFIPRDKMSAHLTIVPPKGGQPASLEMVKQKLTEKGIRYGFIASAIKAAIIEGKADSITIAKGEPVINGKNSQFICTVPEIKIRTPQVAENGNVDYRDLGEITIVHAGDVLMKRKPATPGKASKNVFGEIVNPKPGKNIPFSAGLNGVKPSPEDPDILIATETGQPVIVENGVSVEKTMSVPQVNLKSGNIIFDGSVLIEGDVENGMKVNATGDINIKGMVEGAALDAGGDIIISGAVIGRGDVRDKNGKLNEETACLNAKGSITARFVENVCLKAGNSIFIQDWVIKSELDAYNEIIVGKKDSKKGQIIGGTTKSGILIKAINIGSQAGVPTFVKVGGTATIDAPNDQLKREINELTVSLKQLHKTLAGLRNNPIKQAKEMYEKALLSKNQMEDELKGLKLQYISIEKDKKRAVNVRIVVDKKIYAASTVSVGMLEKKIMEDLGARSFILRNGKLVQVSE